VPNPVQSLRVYIAGATGNVGRELVKAILTAPDLALVGGWSRTDGVDLGTAAGQAPCGVLSSTDLGLSLRKSSPDMVVDFTSPAVVMENLEEYAALRLDAVVGTTGFVESRLAQARLLASQQGLRWGLIANFNLSMNLSLDFLRTIRQHYPYVTVVERHFAGKADAPSGTSLWLAHALADGTAGEVRSKENLPGVMGGQIGGVRILSERLPIPSTYSEHEIIMARRDESISLKVLELSSVVHVDGVLLAIHRLKGLPSGTLITELRDLPAA
jgi:4-hydroxy-tetrahydrodipicolinate reductase